MSRRPSTTGSTARWSHHAAARVEHLLHWAAAPAARIAHPREEHLIPLMVAVGAAEGEAGERVYHEDAFMGGISVSSFRFGAASA